MNNIRRIDDLGRVVIPKHVRNELNLRQGDALEICINDNGSITLLKNKRGGPCMTLIETIKADALTLRKASKANTAALLTLLISEINTVGKNDGNRETTDAEALVIIRKFVKNCNEIISLSKGVASEHTLKAAMEIEILGKYLPKQLTEDKLRDFVKTLITEGSTMGALMGALKAAHGSNYDGRVASRIVKEELNK